MTNLLLATKKQHLTHLKNMMDTSGTYHNLHKLVWIDMVDDSLRAQILQHFQTEAEAMEPIRPVRRKVLSDIDDTLAASEGKSAAGIDFSFAHGTVYPGVLAFYRELDFGPGADETFSISQWLSGKKNREDSGNLCFLSA